MFKDKRLRGALRFLLVGGGLSLLGGALSALLALPHLDVARPRDFGILSFLRQVGLIVYDLARYLPPAWNELIPLNALGVFKHLVLSSFANFVVGLLIAAAILFVLRTTTVFGKRTLESPCEHPASCRRVVLFLLVLPLLAQSYSRAIAALIRYLASEDHQLVFYSTALIATHLLLLATVRSGQYLCRVLQKLFTGTALATLPISLLGTSLMMGRLQTQGQASPEHPNILLISIDSLRRDHLHCYGYHRATSPVIDKLAAEGALFETAVSSSSWTLPSHMTLLTSLSPSDHGVINDGTRLSKDALTLAEVLLEKGYRTAAFVSGPYLTGIYGFYKGFEHYDDYSVCSCGVSEATIALSHRAVTSPGLFRLFRDWVREWSESASQAPFFAFLHMWDVHYDYTPPAPYDSMFDPDYSGSITGEGFYSREEINQHMNSRDLQHILALYDGEIRFTDHYVGKILQVLAEHDQVENTIVVITSDHGEEFFEHGHKGHGKTLYDEVLLVPLIIRFPRLIPGGQRVAEQVRLMDVGSTILGLSGIAAPKKYGRRATQAPHVERDLSPLLTSYSKAWQPSLAFGDLHGKLVSGRSESVKVITDITTGSRETYDLLVDPLERRDVTQEQRFESLWGELGAFQKRMAEGRTVAERVERSEEHLKILRSLGYVQ